VSVIVKRDKFKMRSCNSAKLKQFNKRTYSVIRNSRFIDGAYDKFEWSKDEYKKVIELIRVIGLGRFLKRLIYSHRKEIVLETNLDQAARHISMRKLNVYSIERKHVPSLISLRTRSGIGANDSSYGYEYLDHGCKGFLAEQNGEIIGYIWWGDIKSSFDFHPQSHGFLLKEIIVLGATDTYGFEFFIDSNYRSGGTAIEFFSKFLRALKELGYIRIYGCVHSDNLAALWIYKVFHGKEVRRIAVRRFFLFFLFKNFKYFFDNGLKWLFDTREIYKVKKGSRA
jgi:GNAT superfamily N-acetyltransferase